MFILGWNFVQSHRTYHSSKWHKSKFKIRMADFF